MTYFGIRIHIGIIFLIICFIHLNQSINIDTITINNPTCFGYADGSLIPSVSGSIGIVTYTWSPCCQNLNNVENAPNGTYSLFVEDDLGSDNWTGSLSQPNQIEISAIQNDASRCNEFGNLGNPPKINPNAYYAVNIYGGSPPYNYVWSSDLGTFDNINDLNTKYTGPSERINKLNLTVYDDNGCYNIEQFEVIINDPYLNYDYISPTNLGGSDGILKNIRLTGIYDPSMTGLYNWLFYDKDGITILDSGDSFNPIPDQHGLESGTYKIVISLSCNGQFDLSLPDPIIIDMPSNIKHCDSSDFVNITGGQSPYIYSWTPIYYLTSSDSKLPGFEYNNQLPIIYTLNVTDSNGAWNTKQISVSGLNIDANYLNICDGNPDTLSVNVNDGQGPYTYQWSPATYLSDPNIADPIITINQVESITYNIKVTDSNGCISEKNVIVNSEMPNIGYNTQDVSCFNLGSITNIYISGVLDTGSICWNLKDGSNILRSGISEPDGKIPDIYDLQDGIYYFEIYCNICQYNSEDIIIGSSDNLSINMPNSISYCDLNEEDIIISGGNDLYIFEWTPSEYLIDNTVLYPSISSTAQLPIEFSLKVIDGNGCQTTSSINIYGSPIELASKIENISCMNKDDANITITSIDDSIIKCMWNDNESGCERINIGTGDYIINVVDVCDFVSTLKFNIDFQDSDGDGVIDCFDECPNDLNKITPGICGCEISDLDEDNDGYPFCIDLCDTNANVYDQQCPDIISLYTNNEGENMMISASIPKDELNIIYNITQPGNKYVKRVEVISLPINEIDNKGNIIQTFDLNSIKWNNTLISYDGYDLLISKSIGSVNGFQLNLTYYSYFFNRDCYIYVNSVLDDNELDNYGIVNKIINCSIDSGNYGKYFAKYSSGDSKLSFIIENWPFINNSNRLQVTYQYNSLEGEIKSVETRSNDDVINLMYKLEDDLRMSIDFLTNSIIDDDLKFVEIYTPNKNNITIIFDNFENRVLYDPLLKFFFSDNDETNINDWITWKLPLIMIATLSSFCVLFIFIVYNNRTLRLTIFGEEAIRVENVRKMHRNSKLNFDIVIKSGNISNEQSDFGIDQLNNPSDLIQNNDKEQV